MIASNNLALHIEWIEKTKAYIVDGGLVDLMKSSLPGDIPSDRVAFLRPTSCITTQPSPNTAPQNLVALRQKAGMPPPSSVDIAPRVSRPLVASRQASLEKQQPRARATHAATTASTQKSILDALIRKRPSPSPPSRQDASCDAVIDLTQLSPERNVAKKRALASDDSDSSRKRSKREEDAWQLVDLLDAKVKALYERFEVSESTKMSLDDKKDYYANVSDKKIQSLDEAIARVRTASKSPASTPTPYSTPARSTIIDSTLPPPTLVEKVVPHPESISPPALHSPHVDIARKVVVEEEEEEDAFGEDFNEGLSTPPQDRDDSDDMHSFIDDRDALQQRITNHQVTNITTTAITQLGINPEEDATYTFSSDDDSFEEGTSEANLATPIRHPSQSEIDAIRLSPDVAANFGIQYNQPVETISQDEKIDTSRDSEDNSLEDEYEETEGIEVYSTQLNHERELAIEVNSDDEEEEDLVEETNTTLIKPELWDPIVVPLQQAMQVFSAPAKPVSNHDTDFDDDDPAFHAILMGNAPIPLSNCSRPPVPPGSEGFIDEIYQMLNTVFKLTSFRENQLEAITSTLLNKDVFVLMPTGGGKSLCYQLPALVQGGLSRGTTVVISPLISLMQDQVKHLTDKGVRAGMILSKASPEENRHTVNLFRDGLLLLVYLSPEKANTLPMVQRIISKLYENQQLARVVIDEAHCLSSWGHDFRPDYQSMGFFKQKYPNVAIMALTATANEKVRMDIVHNLHMKHPVTLKQSFNRSNLFYEIKWKSASHVDWIRDYINSKQRDQTGIIYCHSKQSCEQTSAKLELFGIKAAFYHAGMSAPSRFEIQSLWQLGRIKLICATIAFGMGIDKPNVRYVIHLYIPRSLEGYYQETGRAGRDGNHSECIMFYSYRDARTLQSMIQRDDELTPEGRDNHLAKLRQVVQYCENKSDCRRQQVLQYFNESFDPGKCNKQCDNCANSDAALLELRDCTVHAKNIVNLVRSILDQQVTVLHCQDVYKGSSHSKIIKMGHNSNPYHGKGKALDKTEVERIFFYLLNEDCLQEYPVMRAGFASTYVKIGKNAQKVINGQKTVKIMFSTRKDGNGGGAGPTDPRPKSSSRSLSARSSGPPSDLALFRYQDLFVSARQVQMESMESTRITLPPSTFVTSGQFDHVVITPEYIEMHNAHIQYSFEELRKAKIEAQSSIGIPGYQIVSDRALKDMAVKLPTNKKDFSKLDGLTKEQCEYFVHFKKVTTALARERKKKIDATQDTTTDFDTQRPNNTVPLPYFAGAPDSTAAATTTTTKLTTTQRPSQVNRQNNNYKKGKASKRWQDGVKSQRTKKSASQRGSSQRKRSKSTVSPATKKSRADNPNHKALSL